MILDYQTGPSIFLKKDNIGWFGEVVYWGLEEATIGLFTNQPAG